MKSRNDTAPQLEFDFSSQPKDDNERLLDLQFSYRVAGDAGALGKMYSLGHAVALKYIEAEARKNPHVARLPQDEKEEKAHNAITYMIARYLRVKDFAIQKSFTGYLYLRVRHELYYRRKVDAIVDFVDWETFTAQK